MYQPFDRSFVICAAGTRDRRSHLWMAVNLYEARPLLHVLGLAVISNQ
jgi:hypothetical protein